MEQIKQLKMLYDEGLMSKDEYDERRLQVINEMTKTEYNTEGGGGEEEEEQQVVLEDDGGGDRWGEQEQEAVANEPQYEQIQRGQRTDMPKIGAKQSEVEKVIFRAVVGNEIEVREKRERERRENNRGDRC